MEGDCVWEPRSTEDCGRGRRSRWWRRKRRRRRRRKE